MGAHPETGAHLTPTPGTYQAVPSKWTRTVVGVGVRDESDDIDCSEKDDEDVCSPFPFPRGTT